MSPASTLCTVCFLGAAGGAASFGLSACHPSNAGDGTAGSCKGRLQKFLLSKLFDWSINVYSTHTLVA